MWANTRRSRGIHLAMHGLLCVLVLFLVAGSGATGQTSARQRPPLREVDGGALYYSKFSPSLPTTADYFPIGVWMESVVDATDLQKDLDLGLNTYIAPGTDANLDIINASGMHYLTNWNAPGQSGTVLGDEVDMWGGPGDAPWSGNGAAEGKICVPEAAKCGYTIQREIALDAGPDSLKYANYGKGVTFWELETEAARFVNDFQDVVSADNYWFTDPGICGFSEGGVMAGGVRDLTGQECRKAANYGWTVEKLRSLIVPQHSKPVWALIEVGHPSDNAQAPTISTAEIRAAVWFSIIHGARGIVYFNHSFSGPCVSQHVLRDCGEELRTGVRELNGQLAELAPVLNAPFVDQAQAPEAPVDLAVKILSGDLYVLAASTENESAEVRMSVACARDGTAEVVGENRTVRVSRGFIRDTFADSNAVHIYKVSGNSCGL